MVPFVRPDVLSDTVAALVNCDTAMIAAACRAADEGRLARTGKNCEAFDHTAGSAQRHLSKSRDRHLFPRIGRILMARGRDATDAALTTSFGVSQLETFRGWTNELTPS